MYQFNNYRSLNDYAKSLRRTQPDKARILHVGHWQIAVRAVNVLCSDGKRRTVQLSGEPDTFFSIPGHVKVRKDGKSYTIVGFITSDSDGDIKFYPYQYRKNGKILPEW